AEQIVSPPVQEQPEEVPRGEEPVEPVAQPSPLPRKAKKRPASKKTGGKTSGLVACATHTGGDKETQEDNQGAYYAGVVEPWKVLIIADGVTDSPHGGAAAKIAVSTLRSAIVQAHFAKEGMNDGLLEQAYARAASILRQFYDKDETLKGEYEAWQTYQTNIIAIIEDETDFWITYLGDGNIFLHRGELQEDKVVQLVIPGSDDATPAGVLCADESRSKPVYFRFSKSLLAGETIITGSNSAFQLQGEEPAFTIKGMLDLLRNSGHLKSNGKLQDALGSFLGVLAGKGSLRDDATIGLIISPKALDSLLNRRGKTA
ncbi:protein phosphatase 2C domain-containing protein, partial [Chloroflexota bacterium]